MLFAPPYPVPIFLPSAPESWPIWNVYINRSPRALASPGIQMVGRGASGKEENEVREFILLAHSLQGQMVCLFLSGQDHTSRAQKPLPPLTLPGLEMVTIFCS